MGFEHSQQFVGVELLVGHVWAGFHTPNRIEALAGQLEIQSIHHGKPTAQIGWG